jgi:hypothetical protein
MNASILGVGMLTFDLPTHKQFLPLGTDGSLKALTLFFRDLRGKMCNLVEKDSPLILALELALFATLVTDAHSPLTKEEHRDEIMLLHADLRRRFRGLWIQDYKEEGLAASLDWLDKAVHYLYESRRNE